MGNTPNRPDSGMSLIEVLISVTIMSIIALGVATLAQNQNTEMRAISEKMTSAMTRTAVQNLLANPGFCGCLFRGKTFDTTNLANPWSTALTTIPSGYTQPLPAPPTACTPIGSFAVPIAGDLISGSTLRVGSISTAGVVDQGAGNYTANIEIAFDATSVVRGIRNVTVPFLVSVDLTSGTAATRPFVSCSANTSGGGPLNIQRGTVLITGAASPTLCRTITFPTPFANTNYRVTLTPQYLDYGGGSFQLSFGYMTKTTTGINACFDHHGVNLTNNFELDWMAIAD